MIKKQYSISTNVECIYKVKTVKTVQNFVLVASKVCPKKIVLI